MHVEFSRYHSDANSDCHFSLLHSRLGGLGMSQSSSWVPKMKFCEVIISLIVWSWQRIYSWCNLLKIVTDGLAWWYRNVLNSVRPRQTGCLFPDGTLKWIFFNQFHWSFILGVQLINNIPALVQTMAVCRPGDKLCYLNQRWLVYRRIYASLGLNELNFEQNL